MKAALRPVIVSLFTLALCAGAAVAAPKAESPGSGAAAQSMEIEAKTTTYDGKAHTYQVKGGVRITLPQLTVTCDEATVYANDAENQIVKVVFDGNVEATKGTDSFKASRITYLVAERRLTAEGTTRTKLKLPAEGPIKGP
jgi:lipopolysaccharide export system protein LptA